MSGLLWVALPYFAITTLIIGTLYRYWTGERGWSTKSSEFLAKDSLQYPIWFSWTRGQSRRLLVCLRSF